MPDIWTHILCGSEAVKGIKDSALKSLIQKSINLFNLGTQGPDIFYYYGFWTGISKSKIGKLGRLMHTRETGEFFIQGLNYLGEINDEQNYAKMLVYLSGFMCHFTLDSFCHPYIYYNAERESILRKEDYVRNSYHKKLEVIIDTLILENKVGKSSFQYPVYKEIDVGERMPDVVLGFLRKEIEDLYGVSVEEKQINRAYIDMKRGLKILHDPTRVKFSVLSAMERMLKSPDKFTCAIYPKRVNMENDYLNIKHSIWSHPLDDNEEYDSSFYDLYEKAVSEAKKMIDFSLSYLAGKTDREELRGIFHNFSYLTGKPV